MIPTTKQCTKCKEFKPLELFSKGVCKDGLVSWCKKCGCFYAAIYRHTAHGAATILEYGKSEKGKRVIAKYNALPKAREKKAIYIKSEIGKIAVKRSDDKRAYLFPEKMVIKHKFRYFRKKHKIISPEGYHFHHWSYNLKYFDDVLLCPRWFHEKIHKHMSYCQKYMCYKTMSGNLLDTKEKHLSFIQTVVLFRRV